MVLIQLDTDRASVSDPNEALFVEWLRRYIANVVQATDEEVLSSLAAVYGTFPAPDYSANGTGSSPEKTDCTCHPFEWLDLIEWARAVTCANIFSFENPGRRGSFPACLE